MTASINKYRAHRLSVRDLSLIALVTAMTAVMAQISIPMPGGVPLTLQTLAVSLAGILLGERRIEDLVVEPASLPVLLPPTYSAASPLILRVVVLEHTITMGGGPRLPATFRRILRSLTKYHIIADLVLTCRAVGVVHNHITGLVIELHHYRDKGVLSQSK